MVKVIKKMKGKMEMFTESMLVLTSNLYSVNAILTNKLLWIMDCFAVTSLQCLCFR